MGSFVFNILFTVLFSVGPPLSPLRNLSVMWMEPQHSILNSLNPVHRTGIKKDFNAHRDFEKTAGLEEIQTGIYSPTTQTCLLFPEISVSLK